MMLCIEVRVDVADCDLTFVVFDLKFEMLFPGQMQIVHGLEILVVINKIGKHVQYLCIFIYVVKVSTPMKTKMVQSRYLEVCHATDQQEIHQKCH